MKFLTAFFFKAIFIFFLAANSYAQTPDWIWATSPNGVQGGFNYNMAVDSSGNVILNGPFMGSSLTFGEDTVRNFGFDDMLTIKYDPSGKILWARNIGGNDADAGSGVTTDRDGNIYALGAFNSGYMTFDDTTIYNAEVIGRDMLIVKYDPDGNRKWLRIIGGDKDVVGTGITTDNTGNFYVTGYFDNASMIFGTDTVFSNNGKRTMFLVKYDSNGEVVWSKTVSGQGSITARDMISDNNGDIYITGHFADSTITFGTESLSHEAGFDLFLVKYNSKGEALWARSGIGNRDDSGGDLISDKQGNVYLTGSFGSNSIILGEFTLSHAGGGGDFLIVKYDSHGNLIWAKAGGGKRSEGGLGICLDHKDNLYITGGFESSVITFDSLTVEKGNNTSDQDFFVLKYSTEGKALWLNTAGGKFNELGMEAACDNHGNLYISGFFQSDSITIGETTLKRDVDGGHFLFLAKYGVNSTDIVEEFEKNEFLKAFPNPAKSTFHISGIETGNFKITIYSLTGDKIYESFLKNSQTIDLSGKAKGMYIYQLQKEGEVFKTGKLVLE